MRIDFKLSKCLRIHHALLQLIIIKIDFIISSLCHKWFLIVRVLIFNVSKHYYLEINYDCLFPHGKSPLQVESRRVRVPSLGLLRCFWGMQSLALSRDQTRTFSNVIYAA